MEDLVRDVRCHPHHEIARIHMQWTGELEKTLFERMCMLQRLKSHVSTCARLQSRIEPFAHQVVNFLNPSVRGTIAESLTSLDARREVLKGEECWLEASVMKHLEALLIRTGKASQLMGSGQSGTTHARARQYKKFSHRSATFSPSTFSIRDSYVAIGKGVSEGWHAGKIKQIFTHSVLQPSEVYFVIQKFRELSPQLESCDPYRQFPLVGGRLYHPEVKGELEIVTTQDIIAHFAYTPLEDEVFDFPCFHALPLDKVIPPSCDMMSPKPSNLSDLSVRYLGQGATKVAAMYITILLEPEERCDNNADGTLLCHILVIPTNPNLRSFPHQKQTRRPKASKLSASLKKTPFVTGKR